MKNPFKKKVIKYEDPVPTILTPFNATDGTSPRLEHGTDSYYLVGTQLSYFNSFTKNELQLKELADRSNEWIEQDIQALLLPNSVEKETFAKEVIKYMSAIKEKSNTNGESMNLF